MIQILQLRRYELLKTLSVGFEHKMMVSEKRKRRQRVKTRISLRGMSFADIWVICLLWFPLL